MLAQVAHRGYVVSVLGDTEASSGWGAEQSALVDPAGARVGLCPPASALSCSWIMSEQNEARTRYKLGALCHYDECCLFHAPS